MHLEARKADWSMTWVATGPSLSSQPDRPLWKNHEIMEGGSKRNEKNRILSFPAKLTVIKGVKDMSRHGDNQRGQD